MKCSNLWDWSLNRRKIWISPFLPLGGLLAGLQPEWTHLDYRESWDNPEEPLAAAGRLTSHSRVTLCIWAAVRGGHGPMVLQCTRLYHVNRKLKHNVGHNSLEHIMYVWNKVKENSIGNQFTDMTKMPFELELVTSRDPLSMMTLMISKVARSHAAQHTSHVVSAHSCIRTDS